MRRNQMRRNQDETALSARSGTWERRRNHNAQPPFHPQRSAILPSVQHIVHDTAVPSSAESGESLRSLHTPPSIFFVPSSASGRCPSQINEEYELVWCTLCMKQKLTFATIFSGIHTEFRGEALLVPPRLTARLIRIECCDRRTLSLTAFPDRFLYFPRFFCLRAFPVLPFCKYACLTPQ